MFDKTVLGVSQTQGHSAAHGSVSPDETTEMLTQIQTAPRAAEGGWQINRVMSILFLSIGLIAIGVTLNNLYLNYRMVWNLKVNGISVGGKTVSEARQALTESIEEFKRQDIVLRSSEGDFLIRNSDFLPVFSIEEALTSAFMIGHEANPWENTKSRLTSLFHFSHISMTHWFDEKRFVRTITNKIPKLKNNQPIDATVAYVARQFKAVAGVGGLGFDEEGAVKRYDEILGEFRLQEIPVTIVSKDPDVGVDEARRTVNRVVEMLSHQIRLYYTYDGYNYDSWLLIEYRNAIEFKKVKEGDKFTLYPVLSADFIRSNLNRLVAPYMYRAKEDITIREENGKMVIDGVARDGYYLDIQKSIAAINNAIIKGNFDTANSYRAELEVAHLEGGIANPDNKFGITDLLATGITNYFGSPENRKFNINHGAERFQNVIIKPGEEISFVKQMGLVDSTTGYLKELVIVNGDSSYPNWGGGMCQISSTLFRTVFFAGLHVKERHNHSYEVKYYAPTGLDATVYDPAPDLVFQNDTKSLILMQNLVDLKRTKMFFKLFGKKDGRKIMYEGPIDEGVVGEKGDHYRVAWKRDVEFADGTKRSVKFVSTYINKDLVKHHRPDTLQISGPDSSIIETTTALGDSLKSFSGN